MKTVIASVDFSAVTPRVVDAAIKLARLVKGRLVLLHVVPTPSAIRNVLPAIEDVKMRTNSAGHEAEKALLGLKRSFRRKYPKLETLHTTGNPATRIVEQARASRAAYIVLGSHGHSAVRDALLGSVAVVVVKMAPCPVVIIPSMDRASSPPGLA